MSKPTKPIDEILKEMRRVIDEDLPAAVACGDPIGCGDCAEKWKRCLDVIAWQRQKYERLAENYYRAEIMPDYDAVLAARLGEKGEPDVE